MSQSPVEQLLSAIDTRDVGAVMSLCAPDIRFLVVDGRRAEGSESVRRLMEEFLAPLRSTRHRITGQWHVDDVWIAEVQADYELRDYLELKALPRMLLVRPGPDGVTDVRVYGAHEHPVTEHRTGEEGTWLGGRWVPPL